MEQLVLLVDGIAVTISILSLKTNAVDTLTIAPGPDLWSRPILRKFGAVEFFRPEMQ